MARNIIAMAVPMTVAQLINILYNVVDRMYLGRLPGHLALTGLGLCLPIISILMGFANLCGMGGSPLCSICRGRGENEEAERIMGNSFSLLLLFGAALTVLCLIFRRPILYLFGASDVTFPYANDYLTIYILGTLFVMISLGMNPFINAQGFSRMGMITVAVGAAVNIVLDPIFIFLLDMGVRGAALATVISQGCSALWVLKFLTGKKAILKLRLSALRLQAGRVRRILSLGTSGFVMSMTNSLAQVLCNASLEAYSGDLYVGVMTVINSIREIITMPVQGITSGCQPVESHSGVVPARNCLSYRSFASPFSRPWLERAFSSAGRAWVVCSSLACCRVQKAEGSAMQAKPKSSAAAQEKAIRIRRFLFIPPPPLM